MKKQFAKHICFFLAIAAAMLLVPALVSFIPSYTGFFVSVCLFLFFDPLFCLGIGIAAGWDLRKFWYAPLLTALLYWLGAGYFLVAWNTSILFYVVGYAVLGTLAMLATHFVRRFRRKS